jgi:hypothetical protein
MKLGELLRLAARESFGWMRADASLEDLAVVQGRQYLGDARPGWLWEEGGGSRLLSSEMDFDAPFMRFEYIAHVPIAHLFFPETLRDLEAGILSEAGYFNTFTTVMCAFIEGRLRRFRCFYRGADGRERRFDKRSQLRAFRFDDVYPDRRLEWLERKNKRASARSSVTTRRRIT